MTDEEKLKALDPKNPFTQAIKDWANTPEAERQKFYERNAAAIDRWQAETDAMAEDDDTDEKNCLLYTSPSPRD